MSDDPKLSERYRELPREEPPRALDDAILAASRRAVQRRRWYGPVAVAAVITLAVAVTLHIQHDRPSEEVDAVAPQMEVQAVPKAEAPHAAAREQRRDSERLRGAEFQSVPAPAAAPAPTAPPPAADERKAVEALSARTEARPREAEGGAAAARAQRAPGRQAASSVSAFARSAPSPEKWLQGIADLRRQGRHEEADRELAEFRKRYPDYRLTDEIKAKVEKR